AAPAGRPSTTAATTPIATVRCGNLRRNAPPFPVRSLRRRAARGKERAPPAFKRLTRLAGKPTSPTHGASLTPKSAAVGGGSVPRFAPRFGADATRPVRRSDQFGGGRPGELVSQQDDERLEREPGVEVELLEAAPGLAHGLGGALRADHALGSAVHAKLVQPVEVEHGYLGAGAHRDQVAV